MNVVLLSENIVIAISLILTVMFIAILKSNKLDKNKIKTLFFVYCNFMICISISYYLKSFFSTNHFIMFIWIAFCLINVFILKITKLYNSKYGLFFIFSIIFIVQLGYIEYTPYFVRQHDSRDFINYQNGGHFGYMGYIFFNNHLPIGSPKDYWCFYNPPFFYIVSVIFIKLQNFLGTELGACLENLQFLSVTYTMIFNIYVYKILKEIGIKQSINLLISFVGLAPGMIIMSGSLNNDILSIMLSTIAIYYTICWYKEDNLKKLIKIAFSISLAIMTKVSAALIAIAIGFVFLIKIIKEKQKIKTYIINFFIFALIALPIGLWFPIKNLVLYDIPLTYVQSVDLNNTANISEYSLKDRLFNISSRNLKTINVVMEGDSRDYNILLTTIKSFIVDEYIDYENDFIMNISIKIVFYSTIALFLLFITDIIYIGINFKKINNYWILLFGLIFILTTFSYIKFCFDYPFTFTMNFRYIVPNLICYAVITGIACDNNKKIRYLNTITISVFCIGAILLFVNLV